MVVTGKEKGKIGKVLKIIPKNDRVVVEKVNMIKRHQKPGPNVAKGGIIEREGSLPVSNDPDFFGFSYWDFAPLAGPRSLPAD